MTQLSILIPTVSGRFDKVGKLIESLERRAKDLPVEILWLGDNRKRTLSKKREALVQAAKGKYITHLDDDDDLAENFFERVLWAVEQDADVISYCSRATINNQNPFIVHSSITFDGPEVLIDGVPAGHAKYENGVWYDINRKPWHWCTWKASIAKAIEYPDLTYGEDWQIVKRMLAMVKTETRMDEVMHYYLHNDKETTCDGSS
jgi:hypothetical protein